ncbi:MAG: glucarate dehydratase [Gaiellales bacterium]|jgi:glucarate dehydratase|nr:glucarate dehydratase [Gaiellales bacterium]
MRITAVRATPVNIPFHAPYRFSLGSTASVTKTIVEVETDEGVHGIGECADGDRSADITRLGERLSGLDPLDLNECERRCVPVFEHSLWANVTALRRAFGAIEMALWDLRGRAQDTPLHVLLGGAVRREIAFTEYFSFRHPGPSHPGEATPLEIARYCARMVEEYESPTFEGKLATVALDMELEMVREVRAAIGDRPLRLDANHAWTVPTARDVLRRLAPYDIRCIEEPVGSHEELARLRPFTDVAFSAHAPDLRRAVALGVPDFYVLNIVELGGIRRTVEFVRACDQFGIGFWFHSGDTGVASAAYLQLSAALEPIREPSQALFHWYADDVIAEGPFCPRRGLLPVPEGPGLGVTLDPVALARCHERFRDEGAFPSGEPGTPERTQGSFGALRRS